MIDEKVGETWNDFTVKEDEGSREKGKRIGVVKGTKPPPLTQVRGCE